MRYPVEVRPWTAKSVPGVVVPTPTWPLEVMTKAVPEALRKPCPIWFEVVATAKIGTEVEADEEVAWMEKSAQGEVVPIAVYPLEVMRKAVEVPSAWVVLAAVVMAKSGTLESEEVALMERRAQGVVEEMPRFALEAFQKRFALSCEKTPPAPMNGMEPWVRPESVSDGALKDDVAVREPTVNFPTDDEAKKLSTKRPMFAKKLVLVAFVVVTSVAVRFWKLDATVVEVAVSVPTVRLETVEDEEINPP